jgi:peptide/nickel transport system substrate-binding protein
VALAGFAAAQTGSPFLIPSEYNPERGRAGSEVTLALFATGGVKTFNPFVAQADNLSGEVMRTFNSAPLVTRFIDNEWRPLAAASFEIAPDFRSITYTLRRGIRWSDGTPLTVDDYALWWEITGDERTNANFRVATIVGESQTRLVKIDDYTMRFEFGEIPFSPVIKSGANVVPAHIFGPVWRDRGPEGVNVMWGVDTPPAQMVAIGPWRMVSFRQNERIEWERNPNFDWVRLEVAPGDQLPYLERFTQIMTANLDQSFALFRGGTTDVFSPRGADDLRELTSARQGGMAIDIFPNYSSVDSSLWILWNFNSLDPWKANLFRNVNFRRAMSHLADREGMVEAAYGGLGAPMYSFVYQVFPAIYKEFVTYEFNPERAVELLRGLGFTRKDREGFLIDGTGRRIEFDLSTNSGNTQREAIGRIFAAEAANVGVKVNFTPIAFNVLVDQLLAKAQTAAGAPNDRGFDAILLGLTGGTPDQPIGANVFQLGTSLHAWNTSVPAIGPFAPWEIELDRLSKLAETQPDDAARGQLIDRAQRVVQENLPFVYMTSPGAHQVRRTNLGGFFPAEDMNAYYGTYFGFGSGAGVAWFRR